MNSKCNGSLGVESLLLVYAILSIALTSGCSSDSKPASNTAITQAGPKDDSDAKLINFIGGSKEDDRRGDVVFIHGLGGGYLTTWTASNNFVWPEELAKKHQDIGVWSVQYNASPTSWYGNAMPIQDRARNLLEQMRLKKLGEKPTVFVTHSLGGIITKKMLVEAWTASAKAGNNWKQIAENAKAVVFLGTPHNGSDLPEKLSAIAEVYGESVQTEQLIRDNPELRDLANQYKNFASMSEIEHKAFFENEPVRIRGVSIGLIVPIGSSETGLTNCTTLPIDANHFTICKPENDEEQVFLSVDELITNNLLSTSIPLDKTLEDVWADFTTRRNDPIRFNEFKKNYQGKSVVWLAKIVDMNFTKDSSSYGLDLIKDMPGIPSPKEGGLIARFKTEKFDPEVNPNSTALIVEGVLGINNLGLILEESKIISLRRIDENFNPSVFWEEALEERGK